jgi:uncharacterized membrane protein
VTPDPLVADYLVRLEFAARSLPADRRRELSGDVREHIDAALGEEGSRDPVTVRNVLERLGTPEEIVAAEVGPAPAAPAGDAIAAPRDRGWGTLEVAAILLIMPGAIVLPLIGPIIGITLMWLSTAWSTRVKIVVTVIAGLLVVLPVALVLGLRAA